jgi:hypothetical protein
VIEVTPPEAVCAPVSQGANKRAAFRLDLSCPVQLIADTGERGTDDWTSELSGPRTVDTVTEDVSSGGVRIRLAQPMRDGARVTLRLAIPV